MSRIDIVVFPNGGREIFGQIDPAKPEAVSAAVETYLSALEQSDKPREFTGYYDAPDAGDIEWVSYDENNPIVMVEISPEDIAPTADPEIGQYPVERAYKPMELAQLPAEQREKYLLGEA